MNTFADRVKQIRERALMSQDDLAKKARVSQSTVAHIEIGRNSGSKHILSLAQALGVDAHWLETGRGEPTVGLTLRNIQKSSTMNGMPDDIEINQYVGTGGGMGRGVLLRDQPGEIRCLKVSLEWMQKNVPNHTGINNLAIVTGFGPSMRPLFNPGDPLLVDRGITEVDRDAIYFFRIGDEGFIKHLQRVPGVGLVVISENNIYRDWTITPDMDFEVLAMVIKVWTGTDF